MVNALPGNFKVPSRLTVITSWVIISSFYVYYFATLTILQNLNNHGVPVILAVFSDGAYDPLGGSIVRCLALWISGLPLALTVRQVVALDSYCFDYLLCLFIFNLLITTCMVGFPLDQNWYVAFGLHASGVALVAELLFQGKEKGKISD